MKVKDAFIGGNIREFDGSLPEKTEGHQGFSEDNLAALTCVNTFSRLWSLEKVNSFSRLTN
jgi:hypothetical protein